MKRHHVTEMRTNLANIFYMSLFLTIICNYVYLEIRVEIKKSPFGIKIKDLTRILGIT